MHETISLDGNCEFAMWIWMFLIEADEQLMYASTGITRSRGVPKVYQRLLMLVKRIREPVKDRNLAIWLHWQNLAAFLLTFSFFCFCDSYTTMRVWHRLASRQLTSKSLHNQYHPNCGAHFEWTTIRVVAFTEQW